MRIKDYGVLFGKSVVENLSRPGRPLRRYPFQIQRRVLWLYAVGIRRGAVRRGLDRPMSTLAFKVLANEAIRYGRD